MLGLSPPVQKPQGSEFQSDIRALSRWSVGCTTDKFGLDFHQLRLRAVRRVTQDRIE
jgi:hypothetical protein